MSGAPHLSLELWVPALSEERPGKARRGFVGQSWGCCCSPGDALQCQQCCGFSCGSQEHSDFPIFPALWKERMTGNVSPSRNQRATGWLCWRETWDKNLEKGGEGWRGVRDVLQLCSSAVPAAGRERLGQNPEGQARRRKSLNAGGFGKVGDSSVEARAAFPTQSG